jgi:hypothetical protein
MEYQPYRDICRRIDERYERLHGLTFEQSTKAARSTFYDESWGIPRSKARMLSVPRMFLGRRLADDSLLEMRKELYARWPDRLPFQVEVKLKPRSRLQEEDYDDELVDEEDEDDDEDDEGEEDEEEDDEEETL